MGIQLATQSMFLIIIFGSGFNPYTPFHFRTSGNESTATAEFGLPFQTDRQTESPIAQPALLVIYIFGLPANGDAVYFLKAVIVIQFIDDTC